MFEAGDLREWRGHDVVDNEGYKIGTLESVYVDADADQPAFATVTVAQPTQRGLPSCHPPQRPRVRDTLRSPTPSARLGAHRRGSTVRWGAIRGGPLGQRGG